MAEQRLNLNTATPEELTELPGIGPVLAQRIVTYRDTVHPYEQPGDITAVSGIGETGYRAIADRLTVAPPAEVSPPTPGVSLERAEEGATAELATEAEPQAEAELASGEADVLEEELEPEIEAIPPGESLSEEGVTLEEESAEESAEDAPVAEEVSEEVSEEAAPVAEEVSEEASEQAALDLEQEPAEEEALPEAEEELVEEEAAEEAAEEELPPAAFVAPAEERPSRPWWRRLSWLWTAILGGLLGMIFAMVVWAGINGSLDVAHSRAVLRVESDVNGLAADLKTLGTDVEGLRQRLEALEGLTSRMDEVESAVDGLHQQTSELSERADALEEDLVAVSEELQNVSEDVALLQDQAERTQRFFGGLQALLDDVFGEVEGMPEPTPTLTPEGK